MPPTLAFLVGAARDILLHAVPALIVVGGLTLVIVVREIDISIGSTMGVLATVLGIMCSPLRLGLPVEAGIAAVLALGALVGFVNGALVVWGGVPSIIVTLGTLTALQGVNALLLHGEEITRLPDTLRWIGIGRIAGVPVSVWVALICVGASALLATRTAVGRHIFALGSNPTAARLAGLSEKRLKLFVFTLTGVLVAVATIAGVPQIAVIEPSLGRGFELFVITAVLVGGTSINGGRGSVIGGAAAVLGLEGVRTTLVVLRLGESATFWERAVQGAFILLAVLVDARVRERGRRTRPATA